MRLFNFRRQEQQSKFDEKIIYPNQKGFLFINKVFERTLEPGVHKFAKEKGKIIDVYTFSTLNHWVSVVNQTVLTQDNISLKLYYQIQFKIEDEEALRSQTSFNNHNILADVEQYIRMISETLVQNIAADLKSEMLNKQRSDLLDNLGADIQAKIQDYGVRVQQVLLTKIVFPKKIQELFVQQFETQTNDKIDLDKAHHKVSKAKILNDAADLMRDNENIKFLQMMETMTQVAASGRHTFVIGGETYQPPKKPSTK